MREWFGPKALLSRGKAPVVAGLSWLQQQSVFRRWLRRVQVASSWSFACEPVDLSLFSERVQEVTRAVYAYPVRWRGKRLAEGRLLLFVEGQRHDAWLMDIWVHRVCRGAGFGRAVVEELLKQAHHHGAVRVGLMVDVDNHRAIALYKAMGFRIIAEELPSVFVVRKTPQIHMLHEG